MGPNKYALVVTSTCPTRSSASAGDATILAIGDGFRNLNKLSLLHGRGRARLGSNGNSPSLKQLQCLQVIIRLSKSTSLQAEASGQDERKARASDEHCKEYGCLSYHKQWQTTWRTIQVCGKCKQCSYLGTASSHIFQTPGGKYCLWIAWEWSPDMPQKFIKMIGKVFNRMVQLYRKGSSQFSNWLHDTN